MRRIVGVAVAAMLACGLAPGAEGEALAAPLGLDQCREIEGTHQCSGLTRTWDGVPLDTTVTLPSARARRLPLLVELHGFGNSKHEYLDPAEKAYTDNAYGWARDGYAVLTHTARGQWGSCGTLESRLASPVGCAAGYNRLADVRYTVRDAQELIGRLVDEGVADRRRIGVTGDSYGGGQSLMLAALRDRVMMPGGRLVRWRSPEGRPLGIAAAAPVIPWSDLVTAIAPNGRVSATGITGRRAATQPVGVAKTTVMNAIFAAGQFAIGPGQPVGEPFVPGRPMGWFAPPGTDPEADVITWVARTDAGEPYDDALAHQIVRTIANYQSPYYVDPSRAPPPLLLASGFTDDIFPADEVLRFANRTRRLHPRTPISLLLGDFGHQRAQNKPAERRRLRRDLHRFFDHHLLANGAGVREGAAAFVQTCPRDAAPLGPFRAVSFPRLTRRTMSVRFEGARTLSAVGGDPSVGAAIDPATGGGDGCVETASGEAPGTARYRLRTVGRRALVMIGAPRLRARLAVSGAEPHVAQIAARLWDVAPGGSQRLVARGTYRPEQGANRWQLHPGAWRFRRGHAVELELLGNDIPYARPSNGAFQVEVRNLRIGLPVR